MAGRDRGSVTVWLALASFAMIVLVGLAVDLSGQVYASQRAHDVAAQAARVAGQQLSQAQAVRGSSPQADTARAIEAARAYLASAGLDGSVAVTDGGTTIEVTVTAVYETTFLSVIGLTRLQVTGSSRATTVRAVDGTRR